MPVIGLDDLRIVSERQPRPVRRRSPAHARRRIPRQAAEAVQVRHRQVVPEPVRVAPDIRDADEAADGPIEGPARDELSDRRAR